MSVIQYITLPYFQLYFKLAYKEDIQVCDFYGSFLVLLTGAKCTELVFASNACLVETTLECLSVIEYGNIGTVISG